MTSINLLNQDFDNNRGNTKGKIVAFCFRLASLGGKHPVLKILLSPYLVFYKFMFEWVIGFEVPYRTRIGKGLKVYHLQAIVINPNVVIGENFVARQNLTIGSSRPNGKCPVIGNNVECGAQVVIVGDITIGNNVIIGAGSIVISSFPDNCVVVGNPARMVNYMDVNTSNLV